MPSLCAPAPRLRLSLHRGGAVQCPMVDRIESTPRQSSGGWLGCCQHDAAGEAAQRAGRRRAWVL